MPTLNDLAKQMLDLASNLPTIAAEAKAFVGREMVTHLIYHTPVDTTQALSNWQATWGNPAHSFIHPYFPGRRGSTHPESAEEALSVALDNLSVPRPKQDVFLTNNADYIQDLDDGTVSRQAGGFVAGAELVGRQAIANFKPILPTSL